MHNMDDDRPASNSEALNEYAVNAGGERANVAWILTPWDTWQPNPSYRGPPVPHPEDDYAHNDYDEADLRAERLRGG